MIDSPLDTEVLWEYQGDFVFSIEAKLRVETICFCVIFSPGFWQQVLKCVLSLGDQGKKI